MFRRGACALVLPACFPRIRGDVPQPACKALVFIKFSPHTRGCSAIAPEVTETLGVFPAYAGMFRFDFTRACELTGFPRIRGDVPSGATGGHTYVSVFPAYAGMFRRFLWGPQ